MTPDCLVNGRMKRNTSLFLSFTLTVVFEHNLFDDPDCVLLR